MVPRNDDVDVVEAAWVCDDDDDDENLVCGCVCFCYHDDCDDGDMGCDDYIADDEDKTTRTADF